MAKKEDELRQSISQLQILQQRVAIFSQQKQQFQMQLLEVDNALKEVKASKKPVFKLIGGLLIQKTPLVVQKELSETKSDLESKISNLEKQEDKAQKKMIKFQEELSKELK